MNSQNLTNLEWKLFMLEHKQKLRNMVPNPSKETLAVWALEDQRDEMLLKYYKRAEEEEAEEAPDIRITSEFRLK